jgi:hypothetical protein
MIGIEKAQVISQEWVVKVGNGGIPLTALKAGVEIVLLFVVAVFAYNVGQNDAQEGVKFASYLCDKGYYDVASQSYVKCYPVPEGIRIVWKCDFKNGTKALPFFLNYSLNDSIKN